MRIGIYDPYLDTMSGGEKYMLTAALCLSESHKVDIFWDTKDQEEITQLAKRRFGMDLSTLTFVDSLFSPHVSLPTRLRASRSYDALFYLSDGSIPVVACPLFIHFQSPMEWVRVDLRTKVKLSFVREVICNSRFTKSFIDKKFSVTSKVIYPPVTIPEGLSGEKENRILNVGRFGITQAGSSFKKQDVLVQTFSEMVKSGLKGWQFVLILSIRDEDREQFKSFESLCQDLPIELIVNPSNERLWEEYAKAKIYWHAAGYGEDLASHPDRAEHFGISTAEAMGAGAVPVVINAGGQKEIIAHTRNGYLWDTTEELIAYTKALIDDPDVLVRLAEQAKHSAKQFSQESFCHTIQSYLR